MAFWEIGELTDEILNEVKRVIELKAGVNLWTKDVDEKEGKKRQKVLDRFLEKISAPNKKVRNKKKYRDFEFPKPIELTKELKKVIYFNKKIDGKYNKNSFFLIRIVL